MLGVLRGPDTDIRRSLMWAMWLLFGLYVLALLLHGEGYDPLVDGFLGLLTQWVPVAVCWQAVWRAPAGRALIWVAGAVTAFAAGSTFRVLELASDASYSFPSPADAGFLLFYPMVLAGLLVSVLGQGRRLPRAALLDSAVGSLGAGAVLAVLLGPLLMPENAGGSSVVVAIAVAYPLLDLIAVAVAAGIAALPGPAAGRYTVLLILGLTVFALTDVVHAYRVVEGSHQMGTMLDVGWAAGICLTAMWAGDLAYRGLPDGGTGPSSRALTVPAVATTAAATVLIAGTFVPVPEIAVLLAAATLVASGFRTRWAFRQLVTLEEMRRQARTDELTGLPNRRALYAEVSERLAAGQSGSRALLLLDLDRFKEINDSLGHDVGDLLLVRIGRRLSQCLRPADLIARIGGDEFAILLHDTDSEEGVSIAATLRGALARPFTLEGLALQIDASVGIALFPDHGQDLTTLLRKADMAMYAAKTSRSGHHVHVAEDDDRGDKGLRMLQDLRTALAEDQLVLHYQPKIDLANGRVPGVEALVRWNHPDRGLLYPGQFLHLAEEAGLMNLLSNRVLEMALDQASIWRSGCQPLTVAVNLSASSLIDTELPERVKTMLEKRQLPGSAIIVEITEEFMMPDRDRARDILSRLRKNGIRVSIDDFGTGYSSLAYLRDLPVNELKIDRSFVLPMSGDPGAAALVASIINLAQSLGLTVVAEGVENSLLLRELEKYGCDQAQGFHIAPPLPAPELYDWLTARSLKEPNLD